MMMMVLVLIDDDNVEIEDVVDNILVEEEDEQNENVRDGHGYITDVANYHIRIYHGCHGYITLLACV